jgi:hypothetical protein
MAFDASFNHISAIYIIRVTSQIGWKTVLVFCSERDLRGRDRMVVDIHYSNLTKTIITVLHKQIYSNRKVAVYLFMKYSTYLLGKVAVYLFMKYSNYCLGKVAVYLFICLWSTVLICLVRLLYIWTNIQQPYQDNKYCTSSTKKQIYSSLTKTTSIILHIQINKYNLFMKYSTYCLVTVVVYLFMKYSTYCLVTVVVYLFMKYSTYCLGKVASNLTKTIITVLHEQINKYTEALQRQ